VKQDNRWKVTHMTFKMTQEIGDRALVAQAAEEAKAAKK
jgi:hypothetical protein